ncbi:hypothetical protein IMZ48_25960 [Candidatus Bathyarchaeota archaeon]|nr:hypothetical protein [Candidatus Bathyarchaeota archaeon]
MDHEVQVVDRGADFVCPGYFVLNHSSMAGQQTLFAQLWKEYALSDSRYLTSDPFMISVETITVVSPRIEPSPLPPLPKLEG